jgi:hypothetical protein
MAVTEQHIASLNSWEKIARNLLRDLRRITEISCGDCEQYVAKADSISIDACVTAELAIEDLNISHNKIER